MLDITPLLKAYAWQRQRALDRLDAAAAQERTLTQLLRRAANTCFGRDHGYSRIRNVADFQRAVSCGATKTFGATIGRRLSPSSTM